MFSAVFVFQVFPLFKVPEKFQENIGKISVWEPSRRAKVGPEGARGGPGGHLARPPPRPHQGGAWGPWSTCGCPLRLFLPRDEKPSETEPFFTICPLFRRCRASNIGSTMRPLPGTLPEGGTT